MKKSKQVIRATKNGVKRTFTKAIWDNLPQNKMGWVESLDTPDEVAALVGKRAENAAKSESIDPSDEKIDLETEGLSAVPDEVAVEALKKRGPKPSKK